MASSVSDLVKGFRPRLNEYGEVYKGFHQNPDLSMMETGKLMLEESDTAEEVPDAGSGRKTLTRSSPITQSPKALLSLVTGLLSVSTLVFAGDSFKSGIEDGPHLVPLTRFNEIMTSPNLSSTYPIAAPDTSKPYPNDGSAPTPGWRWGISVVADILFTETNSSMTWDLKNQTFTATKISLEAPVDDTTKEALMDESWGICVINWGLNKTAFPDRARQDDGTCSSMLSGRCRRGVETQTAREYRAGSRNCSCPDKDKLPEWCSSEEISFLEARWGCSIRHFNATQVKRWPGVKFDLIDYGGSAHPPRDPKGYYRTASLAWPFMVMFIPGETARAGARPAPPPIPDSAAKLFFLRAKEATPGSSVPEPVGSGGISAGTWVLRKSIAALVVTGVSLML
ncbi:hypothetical protein QBC34DRAFT_477482 [Podospora aff. communis PSN243]|uniref:Uncharacterized protein n=1 Tax=Podospora aff. communis PSN243 TaxID=3040156 RepID=A0AAV9G4T6_9PEZI|nr:hypothetical protein QBC34DRAFT_477482 [Podospora aff. communis PSN243]